MPQPACSMECLPTARPVRNLRPAFKRRFAYRTSGLVALCLLWIFASLPARANDRCELAETAHLGEELLVDLTTATADGSSSCDLGDLPDRWYRWQATEGERVYVLGRSREEIEMSVHTGCPGSAANEIVCGARNSVGGDRLALEFLPEAGETYYLRVAAKEPLAPPAAPYSLSLTPGGVITGVVTDSAGLPLEGIKLDTFRADGPTYTDADGRYRIGGLDLVGRRLHAGEGSDYVVEYWDDFECANLLCLRGGELIAPFPGVVSTANFALERAATIAGLVTDELSGQPLPSQSVLLFRRDQPNPGNSDPDDPLMSTLTGVDGKFRFEGLAAGTYIVQAGGSDGFVSESWDDRPCIPGRCAPELGQPIALSTGEALEAIDFKLRPGLSLSGLIRGEDTLLGLRTIDVHLRDPEGELLLSVLTDSLGRYRFEGLPPGSYRVNSASYFYVNEVWPDTQCAYGPQCPPGGGLPIDLFDAPRDHVNFNLAPGGILEATIRDELDGAPVTHSGTAVYSAEGEFLTSSFDSSNGIVQVVGLPTGEYRAIGFSLDGRYASELYDGFDCPGGRDTCESIAEGTPIEVTQSQTATIDMELKSNEPDCSPSASTLCLNDGRFAVSARWRKPDGVEGQALGSLFTAIDDSAAFYFFDPDNTELVVKVLNACGDFDRFWVFAAGLTNVEVELRVEDTITGHVKTYFNAQGQTFEPIQDTDAFATCASGRADSGAGSVGHGGGYLALALEAPNANSTANAQRHQAASGLAAIEAELRAARRRAAARRIEAERSAIGGAISKADCVPSEAVLCLGHGGRFQVEAIWRTPDGSVGYGVAVPFRADTGLFWFFDSNNIEVVTKVLDACGGNFDRFWIFAGGLTNVEVELYVTDTTSGETRVYLNPQGQSFQPIQDTQAFDTCP